MKKTKNSLSAVFFAAVFLLTVCVFTAQAQGVSNHKNEKDAEKAADKGVTFKIPEKVMPMPKWVGFKGMLMLSSEGPSGIFISYPDEGETLDALRGRAEKSLVKMFVHDDAKVENVQWNSNSTAAHDGDKSETALTKIYDDNTQTVQITFYERQSNGLDFIYGYFARKSKTSDKKGDSANFLDEKGKGSKVFDNFWKTFPKK